VIPCILNFPIYSARPRLFDKPKSKFSFVIVNLSILLLLDRMELHRISFVSFSVSSNRTLKNYRRPLVCSHKAHPLPARHQHTVSYLYPAATTARQSLKNQMFLFKARYSYYCNSLRLAKKLLGDGRFRLLILCFRIGLAWRPGWVAICYEC